MADQRTLHEQIELAESQLDIAAATLRRVRVEIAAGHLPVRLAGSGDVVLSADEAELALDVVALVLAGSPMGEARLAELTKLRWRLEARRG